MSWKIAVLAIAAASFACAPEARTSGDDLPADPPGAAAVTPAPPPPAFKAGTAVSDSTGATVGTVASVVEGERGLMVVVDIDGKLVSVPQETLTLAGERAVSSQTRSQMLAAAGAPP